MRIGQLAAAVDVNPKSIRFYEQIGLLPEPGRRPSGYRDYGEEERERLVFVRTAQRLGLPLADIAEILAFKDRGEAPCAYVCTVLARQAAELDDRIGELEALRDQTASPARRVGRHPARCGRLLPSDRARPDSRRTGQARRRRPSATQASSCPLSGRC
ncbi:MAG: heavy metal-responsive transcriptional regulator [Acidimicrobiales bacterium]